MVANPVFIIATDGTIIHANEGAMTLLKISKAESLNNIFELIPELNQGAEVELACKTVAIGNFKLSVCV